MKKMFASPDTLLMMCLRSEDHARCNAIIQHFNLQSPLAEAARCQIKIEKCSTSYLILRHTKTGRTNSQDREFDAE